MKKAVNINLSGRMFHIDEDAFLVLNNYLSRVKNSYAEQDGGEEIISDIESRIAELFGDKINEKIEVITLQMVQEIIQIMGEPEEFEGEEQEQTRETTTSSHTYYSSSKRLYRDVDNAVFGGVCAGMGAYFNIDMVWVRVLFVLLFVFSVGSIIPVYLILWIVMPAAITTAQKLEMKGENVTVNNIEKTIREEYQEVKERLSKVKDTKTFKKGESWWRNFTKSDKTILIIVAVILGMAFLGNFIQFGMGMRGIGSHVSLPGTIAMGFHFPNVLGLVIGLLVLGFIFKSLFKVFLYVIAFVLLGSLVLKVLGALFYFPFSFC